MKIRIAHSPDSDDAFMFYGLAAGHVPSEEFELEHVLADIESLNRAAFGGTYEITAVSIHAYAHLTERYVLLPHGASMGDRYGPIVVAREDGPSSLNGLRVAVPGELTTAFLALRLFDPDVEHVVMPGGLPLPLGGNVIRRDLGGEAIAKLSRLLHDSIAYGLEHRGEAVEHSMQFGRGLDRERTDEFVGMYVNELTLDYGERGREAVRRLLDDAQAAGLIPSGVQVEFSA
jgi:1,4-dihydroxy-6-naphthoate synthase